MVCLPAAPVCGHPACCICPRPLPSCCLLLQGRQFDVLLDSAVYHVFSGPALAAYLENVAKLVKPGRRIAQPLAAAPPAWLPPRRASPRSHCPLAALTCACPPVFCPAPLYLHLRPHAHPSSPAPGGRVVLLVFSDKQGGDKGPVRVSQAAIHASYPAPAWRVESIQEAVYESMPHAWDGAAHAYLALIRKAEASP